MREAGWPLFIVTRTLRCRLDLRRYVAQAKCSVSSLGYHNAVVLLDADAQTPVNDNGYVEAPPRPPDDDARWPKACACGYVFVDSDDRQVAVHEYYADANGDRWTEGELPPGAMRELWWWPQKGPNGEPWWAVTLPGGDRWDVFGPAANSKTPWAITGTAPKLTASPSIAAPKYHGWLRDGVLTPDCEGRRYA